MTPPFRIGPEAAAELEEAATWYDQQKPGLGSDFVDAVDETMVYIAHWPHSGTPVPDVPLDLPVRQTPVRRFPYQVVYIETPRAIRILAFAHERRSPGYWHKRAT